MKVKSLSLILAILLAGGIFGVYFLNSKSINSTTPTANSDALSRQRGEVPLYTFSGAFTGTISVPGLTLSGSELYGDPSKIKIDSKGVLSVVLPDPSVPDSYQALVAPINALPAWDFRFRRIARSLGTPRAEDLANTTQDEREKYALLKTLFSTETSIDPLSITTKKCFTDIYVSAEIPGAPEFLQKLCQSVVPRELLFTSTLDLAYVRYTYHLFAQAYAAKNKSPCLNLLTAQFSETKPVDRARDSLQSLMLCEAIAARDPRMVIDRVYSMEFLIGKKRCDVYAPFPEAQKLCDQILLSQTQR